METNALVIERLNKIHNVIQFRLSNIACNQGTHSFEFYQVVQRLVKLEDFVLCRYGREYCWEVFGFDD